MKCPVCPATDLLMTSRESIEIDYCPNCRGVWLDRGELDRLIQRDAQAAPPQTATRDDWRGGNRDNDHAYAHNDDRRTRARHDDYRYGRERKKKSFLGELFDFG